MPFRNSFTNPATGSVYVWTTNHLTEESNGVTREVTHLEPIAAGWTDAPPMLQQGAATPRKVRFGGTIIDDYQHAVFLIVTRLSKTQTVLFHHGPDNLDWEVLVTSYEPQRVRVTKGARNGATHVYRYSLELEVIT